MKYLKWHKYECDIYVVGIDNDKFEIIMYGAYKTDDDFHIRIKNYTLDDIQSWERGWTKIDENELKKLKLERL